MCKGPERNLYFSPFKINYCCRFPTLNISWIGELAGREAPYLGCHLGYHLGSSGYCSNEWYWIRWIHWIVSSESYPVKSIQRIVFTESYAPEVLTRALSSVWTSTSSRGAGHAFLVVIYSDLQRVTQHIITQIGSSVHERSDFRRRRWRSFTKEEEDREEARRNEKKKPEEETETVTNPALGAVFMLDFVF